MSLKWSNFVASLISGAAYIPVTLKMTAIIFVISLFLGLVIATVRFYKVPVISQILAVFTTIYMGIPVMLAINVYYLAWYTMFPTIIKIFHLHKTLRDINFSIVAYVTLILSTMTILSEVFRGAYQSIDKLQFEAGYSIGLTKMQTLRRIILPQLVPVVMPNMLNMLTGTLKNMSIIFVIGLYEVMQGALIPCNKTYSYVEGYLAAAVIYWALVFVIERIGNVIEKKSVRFRRRAL